MCFCTFDSRQKLFSICCALFIISVVREKRYFTILSVTKKVQTFESIWTANLNSILIPFSLYSSSSSSSPPLSSSVKALQASKLTIKVLALKYFNRQYSYSPTVLGRVCLHHECEAHAGNFSPRGKTNMRKLLLSLPNLRKIFNTVKFRRAYILERSLFQTTNGRSAHYY